MAKATKVQETVKTVKLQPVNVQTLEVTVVGMTPLITHKWSEKAKRMIRDKKAGKKTKTREVCDPEAECLAATYHTEDGEHGVPVDALKASFINAAHKDIGIEKTLVRKSLFIRCDDSERVLALRGDNPVMREDPVRVGVGSADLRYRPEYRNWEVDMVIDYDATNLQPSDIINLINRAGFGVGIGEQRPEKGKDNGRFRVKTNGRK